MKGYVVLFAWFVVTAVINFLMRKKTAEEWVALGQKYPRYAAIIRLLRAVGVDPVKVVQSVVDFVRGQSQKRIGALAAADEQGSAASIGSADASDVEKN